MQTEFSAKESFIFNKITAAAEELNVLCYVIGGFVRDKMIGRQTKDIDIVCVGNGIQLAEQVAAKFNPAPHIAVFKNFGTAQIKIPFKDKGYAEPEIAEVEFVGARKESYNFESRKPTVETGTLEDDQQRRDFTINTLAISLNKGDYGQLVDPFDGLQHIGGRLIKTPLQPEQTFSDDPLRMMRAIRFAAQLGFTIEEQTFNAIQTNKERIKIISQERITDELNKIMLSSKPSVGWKLLLDSGLLHIIFPQMIDLLGAEYIDGQGHKDNFYHTLQVLDNISEHTYNLWLRWAALLHDIGKPASKRFDAQHGWTFHGHEVIGARMVPKIFAQLKLPQTESMKYVQKLVLLHLRPISVTKENITDSAIRRLLFDAANDIDDLMMLCEADITSKNKYKVKRYLQNFELVRKRLEEVEEADKLRNWQPPITGELIMKTFNLKPGKQVGAIKDAIREAILDGKIDNNYEAAYQFMLNQAAEMQLTPVHF